MLIKQTGDFLVTLLDCEYVPYILKPSRITHRSSTLIDNVFMRAKKMMCSQSFLITDTMSDHYPCILSYCLLYNKSTPCDLVVEKRKLSDEAISKIQQKLLFHDWSYVDRPDITVNDCNKYLASTIDKVMNEYAPKKTV